MNNSVRWTSPTDEVITFYICDYDSNWNNVGGIYMMCKFNNLQNAWEPAYIGQAENFKNRLSGHEKWLPAVRLGARNILAVVEHSESRRDFLERMLIQRFDPPLNKQLKSPALGTGYKQSPALGLGILRRTPLVSV